MLLDTNILIAYLNKEQGVVSALQSFYKEGHTFFISSITRAEILSLSTLTKQDRTQITGFLTQFISLPFNDAIAEEAAQIRRIHRLQLPDAAIAASARLHSLALISRDKVFQRVDGLTVGEI